MVVCRPSTLVCTQLCSLASLAASHSPYPFSTSSSVFYLLLSPFVPSLPLLSSSLLPRGKTIFLFFSLRCPFLSLLSLLSCTLASRVPSPRPRCCLSFSFSCYTPILRSRSCPQDFLPPPMRIFLRRTHKDRESDRESSSDANDADSQAVS